MTSQTESGKAFEYTIANQIAVIYNVDITPRKLLNSLHAAYKNQSQEEQRKCQIAADEAVTFLGGFDKRFENSSKVILPPTAAGKQGDVRDIIVKTSEGEEIGVSAKNRHKALKHSRLAPGIDFGKEWLGVPCTELYWKDIKPIFSVLETQKGLLWKDVTNKVGRFYVPLLDAFINELKRLDQQKPNIVPEELLRYLLGRHDFYKVVKDKDDVSIQSFNFLGTLGWGKKVSLKGRIAEACRKNNTTASVLFNNGWSLLFRIHSAKKEVELSLKFDVQILGLPQEITNHVISLDLNK